MIHNTYIYHGYLSFSIRNIVYNILVPEHTVPMHMLDSRDIVEPHKYDHPWDSCSGLNCEVVSFLKVLSKVAWHIHKSFCRHRMHIRQ